MPTALNYIIHMKHKPHFLWNQVVPTLRSSGLKLLWYCHMGCQNQFWEHHDSVNTMPCTAPSGIWRPPPIVSSSVCHKTRTIYIYILVQLSHQISTIFFQFHYVNYSLLGVHCFLPGRTVLNNNWIIFARKNRKENLQFTLRKELFQKLIKNTKQKHQFYIAGRCAWPQLFSFSPF